MLLSLIVNPFEVEEHPGHDRLLGHRLEKCGLHLHLPAIDAVEQFLTILGCEESSHIEGIHQDFMSGCGMFHDEMTGKAHALDLEADSPRDLEINH